MRTIIVYPINVQACNSNKYPGIYPISVREGRSQENTDKRAAAVIYIFDRGLKFEQFGGILPNCPFSRKSTCCFE